MEQLEYRWTNGTDSDFQKFYLLSEEYYSKIVGGINNRRSFVQYNSSGYIDDVVIAVYNNIAIGCVGLKRYSDTNVEVKRLWVEPNHRRMHLATHLMDMIETKAKQQGYKRTILQTREIMRDAVNLYVNRGYSKIANYPPYDLLEGAICFAKEL